MSNSTALLEDITSSEYKYGFVTDIEADEAPKGLSEDIVRFISAKKKIFLVCIRIVRS
jgi:Fe-S cluster assembly protein SufB